ncbi:DUF1932 domain-containing protein [Methanothermobacter wolfeii]|uniref:DUF1932 domain-containing protein n=1 Tax=Methanothermobacter wolfeii TaxID=145261 RepID=A0A9E7RV74_METWO|nr:MULTISPECIES: NAD(P)-dependent oxidoreductase [Methanothermobacter]NLM02641.1 NAD(P)-dependent oxidoreductase [Methanothermobacter wolfeii]QHN05851.1 NAD(P)-dependent oxidoreductase [Methanothermobacter sp. THM-1]UXH32007.1 DUF1932 domain-containing protein [Methanothermobacter wolfeii]SCM56039.1 putative 28,5 kDa protein in 7S RNA 5'region [Methanothermobacter wolfeii]
MRVGFIGFGEVAHTLAARLIQEGAEVFTSLEGRSPGTMRRARELGVTDSEPEEVYSADIIISAVTPASAVDAARMAGAHVRGTYVDVNNIAPLTVKRALSYIENGRVVDAAIMGSVRRKGADVRIIASGEHAGDFMALNDYGLNIELRGSRVGDASALKMLRSSYTKGVSALLWETLLAAYRMGLEEDVLEVLEYTEGDDFRKSSISRIKSSAGHAERRYEEIHEIEKMLSTVMDPVMTGCIMKVFKRISSMELPHESEDYRDILEAVR